MATPDAATMRRLRQQGKAMPPKDSGGTPRFPIRNADDLANAIRAVGRVRPNTEEARSKVRRYIIGRARALGLSAKIPDSWAGDGTLKDGGDSSSSSGSSQSGSNGPAKAGNPTSGSSDSDADDTGVAAMTARLSRKGMSPAAARIFATRAAKRRKAA